ncbi:DBH-like monooxygenase protein 1 homolog [Ptychodera flava]|uniref:DBH-like monooxygenase protein 1 homolog n=1 Tax=Ptychodera flava TaxID=63121 RepID=UPI00396A71C0
MVRRTVHSLGIVLWVAGAIQHSSRIPVVNKGDKMSVRVKLCCSLLCMAAVVSVCLGSPPTPTDTYTHDALLDDGGKYHLYWKLANDSIIFEVHVETLGYVGFGISPNGGMTNADIVIGWVKDGEAQITDRFATGNREPYIDASQDIELIGGMETDTHTVLTFSRNLQTCDSDDIEITSGTMRLIYSYHADDPESETGLSYHGSQQRGSRSIHLLAVDKVIPAMPTGDDLLTYEFLNPNISVPGDQDTTYWCQAFKMPTLDRKHHMIKYEPVIQEGHEALVHHIIIYQCRYDVEDGYHGFGHECYSPNMPENLTTCTSAIISWAIGGGGFYLPEEAGFPLGEIENGDPNFVLMETHYDNPDQLDSFVDSSGIRIYYTPILREYDASIIELGNTVDYFHAIPPRLTSFTTVGFCSGDCLAEGLNGTSITIFASLLHAHLAGRGVRTRHIRNGEEQAVVAADDTYDFNFQEMRYLPDPVVVQPGDELITECSYNTEGRSSMTYGGLSTLEEMCLNFVYYYPRRSLAKCESFLPFEISLIALCESDNIVINYEEFPPTVVLPASCAGRSVFDIMATQDWNKNIVREFESAYNIGYFSSCERNDPGGLAADSQLVFAPEISSTQVTTDSRCDASASQYSLAVVAMVTLPAVIITAFWS